ncbi:MAG TPA: thiol-disulfide oxidoreductase DCC family protein [Phaeodactylibacter sp.]|nr:thiol-disulfide oxidoreductase DCC family protein [Phaeodactylibacter sp.]
MSQSHPILLFDGVCNLCNNSVQFVVKHDPNAKFRFAVIQSDVGQELLSHFNLPTQELFSVILIENKKAYTRSSAALQLLKNMDSWHRFFYAMIIFPKPIRDYFYKIIANNRYQWFGKKENCMIPTPELKARFL